MPVDLDKIRAQVAARNAGGGSDSSPSSLYDWTAGFLESAVSAVPELFGAEPFDGVEEFRAKNPGGGMVSQLGGTIVPYLGWEAAAMKIPQVARMATAAGAASKTPFVSGAFREVAKLAPFEGARLGSSLALGNDPMEEILNSSLAFGLTGAVGGVAGALGSAAKVLDGVEGFADLDAPIQWQIRQLRAVERDHLSGVKPLDDVSLNAVRRATAELGERVRNDDRLGLLPGSTPDKPVPQRYLPKGLLQADGQAVDKKLSSLVESGFRHGTRFTDQATPGWRDILSKAGVGPLEEFEGLVKNPRFVGGREFSKLLRTVPKSGTLLREGEDGLYVVIKPVELQGKPKKDGTPRTVTRGVLFKTDSPDKFFPVEAKWTRRQDQFNAWQSDIQQKLGKSSLLDISLKTLGAMSQVKGTSKVQNAMANAVGNTVEKFLTPAPFQFKRAALARAAYTSMQATFDGAAAAARRLAFGSKELDPAKNELAQIFTGLFRTAGNQKSIKEMADEAFSETGLKGVAQVLNDEVPVDKLQQLFVDGKVSQKEYDLLMEMDRVGKTVSQGELTPLQRITGKRKYKDLPGHYGIPRTRDGDFRITLKDEAGKTLAVFGANSQKEAVRLADDAIAASQRKWTRTEPFLVNESLERALMFEYSRGKTLTPDQALARTLVNRELAKSKGSPNFLKRENVQGFRTEWDADALTEAFAKHLEVKLKYAASLASREAIEQYADKITILGGKNAWDVLVRRLNDFEGTPGPVARATNEFTDKLLGPVLGKNSATKIAGAMNRWYMHMSLGAGNLAYPITNMMGFLQTSLPHLSYIRNAPPERLARFYSPEIVQARNGMQAISVLDTLKLAGQSWKQLGSKEADWLNVLNRAADDGTISPKFIEEFVGENASKWRSWKSVDPRDWGQNIVQASTLGMESGERLSRANALALGYIVGKNLMGMKDPDRIYAFAKKFTDNTMYRYATPDRATIFAGPVGSTFGLFKNWMLHYMNWMFEGAGMAAADPRRLSAWAPLMWQVGGTTAVGGVGAWPLFELANSMSKMTSGSTVMENLYREINNDQVSNAIFYGLPATLGLSMSQQAEMPFNAPLQDAEFMFTPAIWHRAAALGKAVGDSADWFSATGDLNPLHAQKLQLAWAKALAPSTVYRALQVQDEGLIRGGASGGPLVKDIGTLERIGWALKLSPVDTQKMFDVSTELWNDQERRKRLVSTMGYAMKEAQMGRDYEEVRSIIERAVQMGIDPTRVAASAQARMRAEQGDVLEQRFSPEAVMQYQRSLGK